MKGVLLQGSCIFLALLLPVVNATTVVPYTRTATFTDLTASNAAFNVTVAGYYLIEAIGGGGGGGHKMMYAAGGGGGGGGYSSGVIYFDATTQLNVAIGQGGVAVSIGSDCGTGGDTVVKTSAGVELIRAYG